MRAEQRLTVGVVVTAGGYWSDEMLLKMDSLGRAVARRGFVLITSVCARPCNAAACGAQTTGGLCIGVSPERSRQEHEGKYGAPPDVFDALIFAGPFGLEREALSVQSSDFIIIATPQSGPPRESSIACYEDRLAGILLDSSARRGQVGEIKRHYTTGMTGPAMLYDDNPERLVSRLSRRYLSRRPVRLCNHCAARVQSACLASESPLALDGSARRSGRARIDHRKARLP